MNLRLSMGSAILAAAVAAPAAGAQTADAPLAPLFACRDIAEDAVRLACLDAAVDALRAEAEAGTVIAVDAETLAAEEEAGYGLDEPRSSRRFGLPGFLRRGDGEADAAAADAAGAASTAVTRDETGDITRIEGIGVTEIAENAYGRLILVLEDGQTWRQTDGSNIFISSRTDMSDLEVNVRDGALGSYRLQIYDRRRDAESRWFRAERLR